ncbi:MAG: 16S rRNA (guanine(966)-N(2))-methyltransferase RsmD [Jatrophihabitantaceae bacterium]
MTRIVAGQAKGRRLAVPAKGTRPTSERAREALFSSLAGLVDINGARVLDLFAGSGAVGLEALSRGARTVDFVDSDRTACDVLNRNIAAVGLAGTQVHRRAAATFLVGAGTDEPFDVVFADPPYALGEPQLQALLATLCTPQWLSPSAVVVVERSARGVEPTWPDDRHGLEQVKQKRYGEGMLWYGRRR